MFDCTVLLKVAYVSYIVKRIWYGVVQSCHVTICVSKIVTIPPAHFFQTCSEYIHR